MSVVLGVGSQLLFLASSAASLVGFCFARKIHLSNGPSKRIADFSVFMAYAFGLYLLACLELSLFYFLSGALLLGVLLALLFVFPFALALWAKFYERVETVFRLQIAGLIAGVIAVARFDAHVRHLLLR